jgi:hypothetical protein
MSISGSGGDGSQAAQRRAIAVISEGVRNTALPRGGCLRLNPGSDARALHINLLSDSLQALWICQRSGPRTSLRRTSLLIRRKRRLGSDYKLSIDIPQTTPTSASSEAAPAAARAAAAAVKPLRLMFSIDSAPPAGSQADASPLQNCAYLQSTPAA